MRPLKIFVVLFLLGMITFLAGPREHVDESIDAIRLPADLDQYLATSEGQFDDIIPGTEKTIIWADSTRKASEIALVYLHGFSATRPETAPLSDRLADSLQANLFYTRLQGHGRDGEALANVAINDWFNDTAEALAIAHRLGQKVLLIGTSTGGTLATWAAARLDMSNVLGIILLSPNFGPAAAGADILTWPWARQFAPFFLGKTRSWEGINEGHNHFWTTTYPVEALVTMMALVDFVRESDLSGINTPFLFIYSPEDKVVDAAQTDQMFDRLKMPIKKRVYFSGSENDAQHVLAGDILSPGTTGTVVDIILKFVRELPEKTEN